ncbi:hypothetical protein AYO44_02375 [Planctomycetaceae bacterium SCGC AG-212-F19]|nr:hypothetical protein AYO44_02375 [Planctomycetaceae bacterium SCGC AG-212-F19]
MKSDSPRVGGERVDPPTTSRVCAIANANIVRRIEELFEQFQASAISLREFAEQFPGQASALENLRYGLIKEAQTVSFQLRRAAEQAEVNSAVGVDIVALRAWLVQWLAAVPRDRTDPGRTEDIP